jgi:hypothetical protein
MRLLIAGGILGAMLFGAQAADLPVKAPIVAPVSPYAWLNGFFIGAGVSGAGTNFDVLGNGINGSINANGTVIDGHVSAKFYNDTMYAAVTAGCGYDMTMNASAAGGLPSNHLFCTELVDAGGFLPNLMNVSTSVLPDFLKGAIPFATVGMAQRMSKTGRVAGIGAIMPIANAPNWVAGARAFQVDYSNAQVSSIDIMKTEMYVGIFVEKKFGTGGTGSPLNFHGF